MRITKGSLQKKARLVAGRSIPSSGTAILGGLLLLAFVLGFLSADQGWIQPVSAFATALGRDPAFALASLWQQGAVPQVVMDLAFADYQRLVAQREGALHDGFYLGVESDNVPARVAYNGEELNVELRLLDGTAARFAAEQWPLRLCVLNGTTLSEGQDYTLLPAGDEVVLTWGYLAALREAGLPTTSWTLVQLMVNGRSWGLYTLETVPFVEGEAAETGGTAVVFFDDRHYLRAAAAAHISALDAGFSYARPVVARAAVDLDGEIAGEQDGDVDWETRYRELPERLAQVASGSQSPTSILDVEQVGEFLALTALWRGSAILDWRTLVLAYDTAAGKFIPVGNGGAVAAETPLPRWFFDDPAIQHAYVRHVETLCQPEYLTTLDPEVAATLEDLHRATASDLGYPPAPLVTVRERQSQLEDALTPARTLFVDVDAAEGVLLINLRNVLSLPVVIVGLDFGENAFQPSDFAWVAPESRALLAPGEEDLILRGRTAEGTERVVLRVPTTVLPPDPGEIRVVTRLWGAGEGRTVVVSAWEERR